MFQMTNDHDHRGDVVFVSMDGSWVDVRSHHACMYRTGDNIMMCNVVYGISLACVVTSRR